MFTGLIEEVGLVAQVEEQDGCLHLTVQAARVIPPLSIGESLAIDGMCLTVVDRVGDRAQFDVAAATRAITTADELRPGSPVNLERPLSLESRLGGHVVTGHVDGCGEIVRRVEESGGCWLEIGLAGDLLRYVVSKGSIAVDGVSLTVVDVDPHRVTVHVIPHTLRMTALGRKPVGGRVNVETDLLAKYLEKWTGSSSPDQIRGSEARGLV